MACIDLRSLVWVGFSTRFRRLEFIDGLGLWHFGFLCILGFGATSGLGFDLRDVPLVWIGVILLGFVIHV